MRSGNTKRVMNLRKEQQDGLWEGVVQSESLFRVCVRRRSLLTRAGVGSRQLRQVLDRRLATRPAPLAWPSIRLAGLDSLAHALERGRRCGTSTGRERREERAGQSLPAGGRAAAAGDGLAVEG